MNIMIVMPLGEFGGGAEQMLYTYLATRKNVDTSRLYLVFLSPGSLAESARAQGYTVAIIPAGRVRHVWSILTTQIAISKLLDAWCIDRVLTWMPKANLYVSLPAKRKGIPIFNWRHDIPWRIRGFEKWMLHYTGPKGVACSSHIANEALKQAGPKGLDTIAIYPGVTPLRVDPVASSNIRESIIENGIGPVVGTVARLQPWKRVDLFLQAMAIVKEHFPDIRVVVVGGECHGLSRGYSDNVYVLGRQLLGDSVVFAGDQRHVGNWIYAMDVFVLASQGEPFGISLVEALAAGKPVVACAGGGPEEIIGEDTVGIVLSKDPSPQDMAHAIHSLLSPRHLEIAQKLNPVRAQLFSAQVMAERIDSWVGMTL